MPLRQVRCASCDAIGPARRRPDMAGIVSFASLLTEFARLVAMRVTLEVVALVESHMAVGDRGLERHGCWSGCHTAGCVCWERSDRKPPAAIEHFCPDVRTSAHERY